MWFQLGVARYAFSKGGGPDEMNRPTFAWNSKSVNQEQIVASPVKEAFKVQILQFTKYLSFTRCHHR
jgi:hypothetical protein